MYVYQHHLDGEKTQQKQLITLLLSTPSWPVVGKRRTFGLSSPLNKETYSGTDRITHMLDVNRLIQSQTIFLRRPKITKYNEVIPTMRANFKKSKVGYAINSKEARKEKKI